MATVAITAAPITTVRTVGADTMITTIQAIIAVGMTRITAPIWAHTATDHGYSTVSTFEGWPAKSCPSPFGRQSRTLNSSATTSPH